MKKFYYFIKGLGIITVDCIKDAFTGRVFTNYIDMIKDIIDIGKSGE